MKIQSNGSKSDGAALGSAISGEFQSFLMDIEDLVKSTTSLTGDELQRAKAKLNARISEAKESFEEVGGEIADKARQSVKATDSYVHDHPWQAAGIGAAIGLVIGYALARRL